MGRLVGIGRATAKRAPLLEVEDASITLAAGIAGDVRGATPRRQVTVLFRESWDAACQELGVTLPWLIRRANLLVEGMETPRRGQFRVGEVVLEVTGETAPCQVMEAAHAGLRAALKPDWRGGVCCSVVTAGDIRVGDAVELV